MAVLVKTFVLLSLIQMFNLLSFDTPPTSNQSVGWSLMTSTQNNKFFFFFSFFPFFCVLKGTLRKKIFFFLEKLIFQNCCFPTLPSPLPQIFLHGFYLRFLTCVSVHLFVVCTKKKNVISNDKRQSLLSRSMLIFIFKCDVTFIPFF